MRPYRDRPARLFLALVVAVAAGGLASSPVAGQAECGEFARADFGFRYRFLSGDFLPDGNSGTWVHFLTEPVVSEVDADGPASGRLRSGDVVEAVDGLLITTRAGSRRFAFVESDQVVEVGVRRDGRSVRIPLRPTLSCPEPAPDLEPGGPVDLSRASGFFMRCYECGYDRERGWRFSSPPVVTGVRPDSPAAQAGLRVGDRLLSLGGAPLASPAGAIRFSTARPGDRLEWTVERDGEVVELAWTLPDEG